MDKRKSTRNEETYIKSSECSANTNIVADMSFVTEQWSTSDFRDSLFPGSNFSEIFDIFFFESVNDCALYIGVQLFSTYKLPNYRIQEFFLSVVYTYNSRFLYFLLLSWLEKL